jgi:plastocyanin domain-containing protein
MAEHEETAKVYTCDLPECDTARVVVGGGLPLGHSGTVNVTDDGAVTFFACRATHLRGAIEAVAEAAKKAVAAAESFSAAEKDAAAFEEDHDSLNESNPVDADEDEDGAAFAEKHASAFAG